MSQDLLGDSVKLDPPVQLTFTQSAGEGGSPSSGLDIVTYLNITNRNLHKNLAYKVKTTAPRFY